MTNDGTMVRAFSTRPFKVIAAVVCLLAVVSLQPAHIGSAFAAGSAPTLALVTGSGHALAIAGRAWGKHVVVSARIGDAAGGAALLTSSGGRFTVGLDFTVACGGITFEARDYAGHDLTLRRAGPLCPNRAGDSGPVVVVLRGRIVHPHPVNVTPTSSARRLTIHLGEELVFADTGGPSPFYVPEVDTQHFAVRQHGPRASGPCASANCIPVTGETWSWVAVKRGSTVLSLSPTCRLSHPACELPDRIITVQIVT